MAINVGSAIAYLELDTSQFSESIKGAGMALESFANEATIGMDRLDFSFQDTAVSMSNMEISVASSIMGLKICISEFRLSIMETIEVLKSFAEEILLGKLVKGLNAAGSAIADIKFSGLYNQILKVSTSLSSLSSQATKVTSLGRTFNNLSRTIENVSKSTRDLGMNFTDVKSKIESVAVVVEQLKNKTIELIKQQKANIVQINFTRDAMTGLRQSIEQEIGSFSQLSMSLRRCNDEAKELVKTLKDNLKVALDGFKDSSQNISIKINAELTPSIKKTSDSEGDVGETIKKSAEKAQETTGIFNSISKALEPFILKVKEIISFVEEWIGKFKKVIEILKTIQEFASKFEKLSKLASALQKIISTAEKIIAPIEKVIGIVKKVIGAFSSLEVAASVFANVVKIINPQVLLIVAIIALIAGAAYLIYKNWDGVEEYFGNLWEWIKGVFSKFWVWLQDFFKKWGPTILAIIAPFLGIPLLIYQHWEEIKIGLNKLWIFVQDLIDNLVEKFVEFGTNLADGLWKGIKAGWENIKEGLEWLGNKIKDFFKWLFGINSPSTVFSDYGGFIIDGLIGGLTAGWNRLKEGVAGVADLVKKVFSSETEINSPSKVFIRFGNYIGDGLVVGLGEREEHVSNKMKNITDKIKNIGTISPDLKNLNNIDINGNYKLNSQLQEPRSSRQFSFNPNITMHISVADTGAKGTAQLASELKTMAQNAIKNSMVDEFMADALRL